jgi:hypothetical protein
MERSGNGPISWTSFPRAHQCPEHLVEMPSRQWRDELRQSWTAWFPMNYDDWQSFYRGGTGLDLYCPIW